MLPLISVNSTYMKFKTQPFIQIPKILKIPVCLLLLLPVLTLAQPTTSPWLEQYIRSQASPQLLHILNNPDSFHYQFIYTQINRNKKNHASFTNYFLQVNDTAYFNPASTVKLPVALMALEKMNGLKQKGINKYTPMLTDSSFSGQSKQHTDSSAENKLPSAAHYIKKIFLVSDNDAYNRLYEFIGQQTLNEGLWKKGYTNTRITRRFVRMTETENRHTNAIRFTGINNTIYTQPAAYSNIKFDYSKPHYVGKGYLNRNDSLVNEPMDFTTHNIFTLRNMQHMLQAVLFPASVPAKHRFMLTADDREFLLLNMSAYPSASLFPKYDTTEYFDSYCKFFFFKAGKEKVPPYIRIFNKPGWSYGFLTDVSYIVDFKNQVECMLTATIYTNSDGILNDDKYEYDTVGYPFFKELGQIMYNYELQRKPAFKADLSQFDLRK